ncbi:ABC transporter substrate-binding protein [Mycolicibacterium mageritense]|uniref:Oligopeptide-binding protein OppA n=1 Tax=Mycolicibacterium mageritense TaxID=53462 RepID=A0AAI8TTR6_MYCME|nr:ABC transporter substrate-binding protein [Mycolicibacterium mageritense]TXI55337.1 MAG: ABC transporter substrate-binding protein [Mycolicibacterium mageritense]BDY28800.1 Oligopeptide-binding protein OppA [Mycolicibacterium mageritense]
MQIRRASARFVAIVAASCAALSGCGAGDQQGASNAGTAETTGALPTDIPDTIRIGVGASTVSIDPNRATQEVDVMALAMISGTLLIQSGGKAVPGLASGCEFDKSQLNYTCTLRDGLKFSDGSPLTSADVVASFERALHDPANANAGIIDSLESVAAPNPAKAIFTLRQPTASFPLALTEAPVGIFPAAAATNPRFWNDPVSAGPYVMVSNNSNEVVFAKNGNYPMELQPVVSNVEFKVIVDTNTRLAQLNTGQIDIANQLSASLAKQVKPPAKAYATPQYGGVYLYLNNLSKPLDDPKVRQAISAAIDRNQINDIAYLGQNKVLGSFLPSSMEGHDAGAPTGRDVEKASALLAGTACESGCNLSIMVRSGFAPYDAIATVVQQNLAEVGIKVSTQLVDQATADTNEQNGNFQMEVGNLFDLVNAPELVMLPIGLTREGGINSLYSSYASPEMNTLVGQLSAAADPAARAEVLAKVNELFARDLPFVPLVDQANIWASSLSPRIVAFTPAGVYQVGTAKTGPGQ